MTALKELKPIFSCFAVCCVVLMTFSGCPSQPSKDADNAQTKSGQSPGESSNDSTLKLVATTGQINSALTEITKGTNAEIKLLCGPGVDPHSFSASTNDVQAMLDANLIVYNGFHLEAKLSEHLHGPFEAKAFSMASVFPEGDRLDWEEDGEVDPEAPFDPHIWNHLPGWSKCVLGLGDKLAELDSANAKAYKTNAKAYADEINDAHHWAGEKLKALPSDRRIIVSAHDAFNYFANVYEMETLAVLGIGNDPEADIKTMRKVADTVCEKKIPAIFMESITNPKVTQALQEACEANDWKVELVSQPLYSDDLGEKPPHDTFLGAFRSNVEIICNSLSKGNLLSKESSSVVESSNPPKEFYIDVRSQAEWDEGHLENTVLIPHTEIVEKIKEVTTDKNARLCLFWRKGGRARAALKALKKEGYKNVVNLGTVEKAKSEMESSKTQND